MKYNDQLIKKDNNETCLYSSLYKDNGLFSQIMKNSPYPMHICSPDGTMLLANDSFLKFAKISESERLYRKHNILTNPNLDRWGIKDFTQRAFRGEVVFAYDIKVPLREITELLGDGQELACDCIFHNISAYPLWRDKGQLLCIVFVFITSRQYHDREEIIKGKQYIDENWQKGFNIDELTNIVHISRYHYERLFKQCTGITPFQYYQNLKIEKIKEKLCQPNTTITEAFAACGLDYNGSFIKTFIKKTGMTPSQYRTKMFEGELIKKSSEI